MKELNIMEATVYTSPNPLTLICSLNEDGTTNLAPICFVSYLSFNPPMIGFSAGKQSHTGKRVRETGGVVCLEWLWKSRVCNRRLNAATP